MCTTQLVILSNNFGYNSYFQSLSCFGLVSSNSNLGQIIKKQTKPVIEKLEGICEKN